MPKAPTDRTTVGKGFKRCPVCGCRYQGTLDKHLSEDITDDDNVSRCDWRLCEQRIYRRVQVLADQGWRLAGSSGAKTAVLVAISHPHLAMHTTNGTVNLHISRATLSPERDPKAWWIKAWALPLTTLTGWSLRKRAQVICELDGMVEVQEVIESVHRMEGPAGILQLEGTSVIPVRCGVVYGVLPPDNCSKLIETCILPHGHGDRIAHKGSKTGILWTKDWVSTVEDPIDPGLDAHDLAELFKNGYSGTTDDW